ncbi:hypothetical protein ECABU_c05620 [Escherichia coli ABU 83972]|nr:hypothetical protein ECABU_c05620 [Escherichia coli ABU 83972]
MQLIPFFCKIQQLFINIINEIVINYYL